VHRGVRPLPRFDRDLVEQLVTRTRELGIEVHLETQVEAVEQNADHLIVQTSASGQKLTLDADMVVHSAGRVPEIEKLNLASARVEWDNRGVKVNEFLQSVSNTAVYAAGDAAATEGPPLTPVAGYEGAIVAANLLNGNSQKPNYLGIPTVVFAIPPLASVGLSEMQARLQNLQFRVNQEMTSSWYSSRRIGETHSGFKVLVEEGTDRILGAHVLGEGAGEVINLFAFGMRSGMTATQLKQAIFAYPTHGSNLPYML
jgi:glutathione reductase (NADPH)